MALPSGTVLEYQTGGNQNYGGGFDASYGGTDYSQSTSPILNRTDLVCTAGSTTITTATGGLTSAMVGNVLNLYTVDGTGNAAGLYMITVITNATTMTVDRAVGATNNMTSGDGNIGGCLQIPTDAHFESLTGGNVAWIKTGSYSVSAINVASTSATGVSTIKIFGYTSTRGDKTEGANIPSLAVGGNSVTFGSYWFIANLSISGSRSANFICSFGTSSRAWNCHVENTNANATSIAASIGAGAIAYFCKFKAQYGYATCAVDGGTFYFCKIVDSLVGSSVITNNKMTYVFCTFDNNTTHFIGASGTRSTGASFIHCIFYSGTTGISVAQASSVSIMMSVFKDITTAITDSATNTGAVAKFNLFHGCATNAVNVVLDSTNIIDQDPLFVDAANSDFTTRSGSPALNAAPELSMIGLIGGSYKFNLGIDQGDHSVAGGPTFHGWAS